MDYEIVRRKDDGTFDLFMKDRKGNLDFIKNFVKLDQAKDEIESMKKPMSQTDMMTFVNDLVKTLKR